MPRIRQLRLVTPGKQRNGQTVTEGHLQQVVKHYNADARPPVTLGHPKDSGTLAFGRAVSPKLKAGALVLEIQYTPVLEALEDQGYVEGFSAGIYPHPGTGEYYLHHVAALGELPPAADIKTLSAESLPEVERDKLIILSVEEESEMDEEKVKKLLADALEPLQKAVAELKAKANAVPKTDKNPGTGDGTGSGNEADSKTKKELSVAMETIKGDRIAAIQDSAAAKGLSDEQIKPLVTMLKNTPAVELAASGDESVYTHAKAFIEGLDSPEDNNGLETPLELAADDGKPLDIGDLANKF